MEAAQAKAGCQSQCGNLSVPYPFGTEDGCFMDTKFFIKCNKSVEPPKALLQNSTIDVLHIDLDAGELRILNWLGSDCYNSSGSSFCFSTWLNSGLYNISSTKKKFTAIGYDTYAFITGSVGQDYATGCLSLCDDISDVINGSCSGVREYDISLASYYNHSRILSFNPCSHAFVVEEGEYEFFASHLNNSGEDWKLPMILDWTIGDQSCSEAKKDPETYACKENTICREPENGNGYLCKCGDVSRGTHMLKSDIDECETLRPCSSTCHNTFEGFYYSCPKGYEGDGRRDGSGCSPMVNHHNWKLHITQTAIG
ncbi:hypothetical protein ES319_A02G117000v1 [Gossypium barbadense]|uniref:EGF-like calcium-binding domain-containing protein n=1 Tax=Gossypium barbadense TaxID=3634 RepID=A0A5J5WRJ2_GOSBA|nr:hypothetical protein ES319_A02G117000v1 [Gossypium barbadense]